MGSRWTKRAGLLVLLALLTGSAMADVPRFSCAMGAGGGSLYHRSYVGGTPSAAGTGRYTSGTWWIDVGWGFVQRRLTAGIRAHSLRVPLEGGGGVGFLDVFPVVYHIGYHQPAWGERLQGFVDIGGGVARVRLREGERIDRFESLDGGPIGLSRRYPPVLELRAGIDLSLASQLELELSWSSVLMNTEVSYRPVPGGSEAEFIADEGYKVQGRHMMLTAGVRWWFEWF